MAERPTAPGCIAKYKLCELTGLTDRRHRQLADEGYFPQPILGQYQLTPTIRGLFRYFTEQLHKKNDSLAEERKLLTRSRRETSNENLAILRREYMKAADVGPALRNLSLHQRAVLQRKLETELGPKLANRSYAQIRPQLQTVVDELCKIMNQGIAGWLTSEDPPK